MAPSGRSSLTLWRIGCATNTTWSASSSQSTSRPRVGWNAATTRCWRTSNARHTTTSRWITASSLVYIAPTKVNLSLTEERWPDIAFPQDARALRNRQTESRSLTRKTIACACYDWANSAFALSVLAVLFPLVLGSYWSVGDGGAVVTARLAWITCSCQCNCQRITAPIFGTIADAGRLPQNASCFYLASAWCAIDDRRPSLWSGRVTGRWRSALYLIASIGYYSSTVFYDSLLIDVTEPRSLQLRLNAGILAWLFGRRSVTCAALSGC